MAHWHRAAYQPVSTVGPGGLRPIAVTLHHQAGNGNPASIYESRRVSAHFWLPRSGSPVQHCDTSVQAWHGVSHNAYSIGVETEGCGSPPHADPLTDNQLSLFGELMAWANVTHGIPLQLSESVTTPGLNYHRCAGGPSTACPCDVRVNARPEILRRAGSPQPSPFPPTQDTDMIASTTGQGYWTTTGDGAIYTYGDAVYQGNAMGKVTGRIVGIAGHGTDGYWLLASDGGVFAFGSAKFLGRPDRV